MCQVHASIFGRPKANLYYTEYLFDGLDTKFDPEPFLVKDAQDHNKNPSPANIDRITEKFGVKKFFGLIHESDLDAVFSNTAPQSITLKNTLKNHVMQGVVNYPYNLDSAKFNVVVKTVPVGNPPPKRRTHWERFLDDVLDNRHKIAHGALSSNPNSITEIRSNLVKLEILQLVILMVICEQIK